MYLLLLKQMVKFDLNIVVFKLSIKLKKRLFRKLCNTISEVKRRKGEKMNERNRKGEKK